MMDANNAMILGFVENLIFTTRVEGVIENEGMGVHWVTPLGDWIEPDYEKIISLQPILILIDIDLAEIQWESWIRAVKSNPATAHIPLLCFGSHKNVDIFNAVYQAGADQVVARSRFFSSMPDLFRKFRSMS
ncbi:MAG: hypothetical protein MUO62_08930 [Anaerolineales bacterium]|nr:hypothetical protein [Anaerolineales bacterium]